MIGFRPGRGHALMAGLAETLGGLLLALGLLTPLASASLISVMLVAVFSVHIKKGFFGQNGGYEYNLLLAVAALALAFTGPGSLSINALAGYTESGLLWGLGASGLGILGGIVPLIQRKPAPTKQAATGS